MCWEGVINILPWHPTPRTQQLCLVVPSTFRFPHPALRFWNTSNYQNQILIKSSYKQLFQFNHPFFSGPLPGIKKVINFSSRVLRIKMTLGSREKKGHPFLSGPLPGPAGKNDLRLSGEKKLIRFSPDPSPVKKGHQFFLPVLTKKIDLRQIFDRGMCI